MSLAERIVTMGLVGLCWGASATEFSVQRKNGQHVVSGARLAEAEGAAVKALPGGGGFAVCLEDRCAIVPGVFRSEGEVWVPLDSLASALGGTLTWNDQHTSVQFELSENSAVNDNEKAGVGGLAPDIGLTLLDGSSVRLSELRGKRVLINSWASW